MALSNRDKLDALYKNFQRVSEDAIAKERSNRIINATTMRTTTNTKVEDFSWLTNFATMTKWDDERKLSGLKAENFSITVDKYESTLPIEREDIEDGRLGHYETMISQHTTVYERKRRNQIADILLNAKTETGYDGQGLISTAHPNEVGSAQSNYAGDTATLSKTELETAEKNMKKFKADNGEFLDIIPDTLLVGPDLAATAEDILGLTTDTANASDNKFFQRYNLIEDPRITGSQWYLLDTSQGVGPIILVDRIQLQTDRMTNPETSDHVFKNDQFLFGLRARWGTGVGLWQTIYAGNL